ncbi:MAG: hypothetical protein HYR73_01380, partial [Candidatus Eisenbacteria bacterium]|nr:hypothetical protein [Candidatus Eisenbacteria bacterium]
MTLGRREENDEGASASATVDLVCMGNTVVDDVVYSDGRTRIEQAGGAALYQALAARLWGARVGVVSLAGSDYPPRMLEALARRSIDWR